MRFEEKVKAFLISIEKKFYITFMAAIVCGLFAHLYQFTNKNFNYDELGQTPAGFGAGIALGRWGLQIIGDLVGHLFRNYSLPMINGMVTLIFVAFSACIIVKAFELNDLVVCGLIGAIISVFPSLVSTYFFMFTAPYYGFAMLLSCIAGMMITKGCKSKSIGSTIGGFAFLTFAIGIYQSYSAVTLCILLIDIVVAFYLGKEDWKKLLWRGLTYCILFAFSIVIYIVITKISVIITGIQLDGYRGMNEMGSVNLGMIFFACLKTYKNYILTITPKDVYQINPVKSVMFIILIINLVNAFIVIERMVGRRTCNDESNSGNNTGTESIMVKVGYLISTVLLPIAFFFSEVLLQGGGAYAIMTYSAVFIFIFPLIMYEKRFNRQKSAGYIDVSDSDTVHNNRFASIISKMEKIDVIGTALCVSVALNAIIYIWFANGNYQALQYTTYHDLAYFQTLATQIKSLDGYEPDMKVALVGSGFDDPTFKAGGLMENYFDIGGKWSTNVNYFNNIYLWTSYLGYTPEIIEFSQSGKIRELEEVKKMPCYPSSGSIAIIGDMVVIKTTD